MKTLIVAFLLFSFGAHAQVPACPDCSAGARAAAQQLAAQKFNCNYGPVSLQRGFRCAGVVPGYTQPVNIFIAPGLQLDRDFAVAYFFHGWWTNPKVSPFDGEVGDFGAFVAASGRNLILVIPQSRGHNDDYNTQLNTAAKVNAFMTSVETALGHAGLTTTNATPRLIAGHSAAYVQLGRMGDFALAGTVPMLRSLRGAALLDTAYGYRAGLVSLLDVQCANPSATFFQAFNPNDGSVDKRNTNSRIHTEVTTTHKCAKATLVYTPDPGTVHVQFPRKYLGQFFTTALPDLTVDATYNTAER